MQAKLAAVEAENVSLQSRQPTAEEVDEECYACSGPLEVDGGDVWGRAICYYCVEWCAKRPPRGSWVEEEMAGDLCAG